MVNEPSLGTILEKVFGDADWHKVVNRPGVWAYSRASGSWQPMIKQEETMVTDFDMNRLHVDQVTERMAEQAARTDDPAVNMAVGEQVVPAAKLDEMAELVAFYDQLTEAINKAQVQRAEVQDKIKAAMGKSTVATLGKVPAFTFQNKETWRTADIEKAMPHLVNQYRITKTVEVVDWPRFIEHHRASVVDYQTREFRRVSGTRATRG